MGMTINARNLEYVLCCFSDHPLQEIRDLGIALFKAVANLAPSLVKYTTRGLYPRQNSVDLSDTLPHAIAPDFSMSSGPCARLLNSTPDAERVVLQAISFSLYRSVADSAVNLASAYRDIFRNMREHDQSPRELELASLTYEAEISASCFAQLKRHRMMTILTQPYWPSSGAIIPPSIRAIGGEDQFADLIQSTTKLAAELYADHPLLCPYLLTNAHKKRVTLHLSARELYHISRLRCDEHAQWEIRELAGQMLTQARELWPNLFMLACGKHEFESVYQRNYPS
jgi:thymidylate synthase ThyX